MKKGFFKRFWWLFLLLAAVAAGVIVAVVLLAGDGGERDTDGDGGRDTGRGSSSLVAPEDERETDPEKIFVLTVDDFPGQTVVNLDDDPTTNFMVYQKGVEVLEERETLVSMDEEARVYVFEDPSSDLKNARRGDILVIPLAGTFRQLAVLVDELERDGDTLTLTGGELDLSELISYADIDMDLSFSAEDMEFDSASLREGESLEFLAPGVPSDAEIASGASPTAARTGSGPRVASSLAPAIAQTGSAPRTARPLALWVPAAIWLLEGGKIDVDVNSPGFQFTFPLALNTSLDVPAGVGGAGVTASLGGSVTAGVRNIHVILRVSVWNLYFRSMVVFDIPSGLTLSGSLNVHGDIVNRELVPVVLPIGGPLVVKAAPVVKVTAAGELDGSISGRRTDRLGYDLQMCVADPYMHNLSQSAVEDVDVDLYLSGSLEQMMGIKVSTGILGVGDVYGQLLCGFRAEGREASSLSAWDDSPDLYHPCSNCIDGDLYAKLSLSVGYEIPLLERLNFNQELESSVQQKLPGEFGDFYVTKGLNSADPEKWSGGLGLCPKIRFKTTVTLRYCDRELVEGGLVDWYDEANDKTITSHYSEEDGKAYIYLPNGIHRLNAGCDFHETSALVTVEGEPTQTEIVFEPAKPRLFVFRKYGELNYDLWLEPILRAVCPDTFFLDFLDDYDPIFDQIERYNIKAGDMVLYVTSSTKWNLDARLMVVSIGQGFTGVTSYYRSYVDPLTLRLYIQCPDYYYDSYQDRDIFRSNPMMCVGTVSEFAMEFVQNHRLTSEYAFQSPVPTTFGLPYYQTYEELTAAVPSIWEQQLPQRLQPMLDLIAEIALGETDAGLGGGAGGGGAGGGGGSSW